MNEMIIWFIGFVGVIITISLACFLQWKLAQKEEWYLGLILPFLYFWDSLPDVLSTEPVRIGAVLLGTNVETIILLIFYSICRTKLKQKKEYETMKVKDLS